MGDEPFAVLLLDMLSRGSMEQMLAAYEARREHHRGGRGAAGPEHQYGIVSVARNSG